MTRTKHTGEHAVNCPACITEAEKARMPWQASYIDVFSTTTGDALRAKHSHKRKAWNVKCSKCGRSFSSSVDFHTHVAQGCK